MTKGVSKEQLDRINELAHKKKTVGLTEEELAEQKVLYKIFLDDFRARLKQQLDNIEIVEPDDPRLYNARFDKFDKIKN
ncbi:MAG: DUF896 domain-containing protein [Firmicutes bacterium]|nr:DUF896 domain-containing protein [Bacillota bacterium]